MQRPLDADGGAVLFQKERNRAGHYRGRHARPGQFQPPATPRPDHLLRVLLGQSGARCEQPLDPVPRCDQIRLDHEVETRRPPRAVRRHHIVRAPRRLLRVQRPHRDRIGRIAWRDDPAEHRLAVRRLAKVPRRCHDDDPGADRTLHSLAQRIQPPRLHYGRAQREVDDADVVLEPIRNHPVDAGDHVAGPPLALRVQHSDIDKHRARRDADTVGLGRIPVGGNDARDVRAVAELVLPVCLLLGEINVLEDPAAQLRHDADARIENSHHHAATGQPRCTADARMYEVRANRRIGHTHV